MYAACLQRSSFLLASKTPLALTSKIKYSIVVISLRDIKLNYKQIERQTLHYTNVASYPTTVVLSINSVSYLQDKITSSIQVIV